MRRPKRAGAGLDRQVETYRDALASVYRQIEDEVPPKRLRQMKSQIRYHFSVIVRERIGDDIATLDLFGLRKESIKDTNRQAAEQQRALLETVGFLAEDTDSTNAAARLVHGALYLVKMAAEAGLADADQATREGIRNSLREIAQRLPELATAPTRIDLAREILQSIEPGCIRGFSGETRDELSALLVAITIESGRLQADLTGASRLTDLPTVS